MLVCWTFLLLIPPFHPHIPGTTQCAFESNVLLSTKVQEYNRKRRVSHRRRERDATHYRRFRDAHPYTSSSPIHFVRAKRGRIPTYRDRVITREQPSPYVESTDTNTQILSFTLNATGFDSLKRKWMAFTESIIPAGQIITLHSPLGT